MAGKIFVGKNILVEKFGTPKFGLTWGQIWPETEPDLGPGKKFGLNRGQIWPKKGPETEPDLALLFFFHSKIWPIMGPYLT